MSGHWPYCHEEDSARAAAAAAVVKRQPPPPRRAHKCYRCRPLAPRVHRWMSPSAAMAAADVPPKFGRLMLNADQIQSARVRVLSAHGLPRHRAETHRHPRGRESCPRIPNSGTMPRRRRRSCAGSAARKVWVGEFERAETAIEDLQVLFEFFKEGESTEEESHGPVWD